MPKGVYDRKPRLNPVGPVKVVTSRSGDPFRRARIAALTTVCISGATNEDWEATAAWVELGSCESEKAMRMYFLEQVANHQRAMVMDSDRLLKMLQRLADFALPDNPAQAGPGASPRSSVGSA